ncbi:MAG: tetratricopeptide repeat protein [Acidobacteria bacterium]|nr:tetratricopeptide repeat protein [Acidobacteriota bacterium]
MEKRKIQTMVALCGWWLIAGFTIWAQPAKQATNNPDRIFARAVQLHQAGDLENAIKEYQAFLAERPERTDARSNLGAVLARLGRFQEAIEQYNRALLLDGRNPGIRFNLAVAYYKSARIVLASQELEKVVAIQPENPNATLLLADCYLQMGEYPKIIALLTPLEAKYPQDKALAYLLGTALLRDKQAEKGQQQIEKIMRGGDSAEAHMLLGTTHLLSADYANAVKELAEAAKLNPKLPTVHAFYGRALTMTGNTDQAKEEFRLELENNPNDFDANLQMGIILKQDQNPDEALKYFRRALLVRPAEPNARFYIESIRVGQGKIAEALPELEQLVKDAPDFVEAHVMLATVYYRLRRKADGDREQAIVNKLNAERQAKQPGAQEKPE